MQGLFYFFLFRESADAGNQPAFDRLGDHGAETGSPFLYISGRGRSCSSRCRDETDTQGLGITMSESERDSGLSRDSAKTYFHEDSDEASDPRPGL